MHCTLQCIVVMVGIVILLGIVVEGMAVVLHSIVYTIHCIVVEGRVDDNWVQLFLLGLLTIGRWGGVIPAGLTSFSLLYFNFNFPTQLLFFALLYFTLLYCYRGSQQNHSLSSSLSLYLSFSLSLSLLLSFCWSCHVSSSL